LKVRGCGLKGVGFGDVERWVNVGVGGFIDGNEGCIFKMGSRRGEVRVI
jgi:hypothetical protein